MRSLRDDVRRRLRMQSVRQSLGGRYEGRKVTHTAAVVGRNQISIKGQAYNAVTELAVGSSMEVVNVGRPGQALYAAKSGGAVAVTGGSGSSSSSSSSGDGLDASEVLALIDGTRGLSVVLGKIGVSLPTSPGLEFNGGGALKVKSYHGLVLSSNGVGIDIKSTSGLVLDSAGLAVGAGDGIEVLANSIAVDLATNSGLLFSGGDLALGTPGAVSATSTASVTSTTHTHPVTASSDVSAGTASLLKSTSAGGLGLASMFTTGAVDVGEGLTAGNNTIRMIYHTHDYPHTHLVVNPTALWSLDEQFGLDVDDNLLVRGWIVGKHAIQVEGATMLVHFDGMPPYNSNWTGNPTGHMGQPAAVAGTPAYYEGVFQGSKAIGITSGGTNLVRNPTMGNGLTTYSGSASLSSVRAFVGTQSAYYSGSPSGDVLRSGSYTMNVAAGSKAYLSAWVYCSVEGMAYVNAFGGWGSAAGAVNLKSGEWELISVMWENTTGSTQDVRMEIETALTGYLWMDALSLTVDVPCVFASGEMPNGTWTGTAHNSSTTVASGHVTYEDTTIVPTSRGTIACWFRVPWGNNHESAPSVTLWAVGNDNNFRFTKFNANPSWMFYMGEVGQHSNIRIDSAGGEHTEWNYLVVTYNVDEDVSLVYLNGVVISTGTAEEFTAGALQVGHSENGDHLNGYIDDFCVFGRVLNEDEIRAIYESNAPVFAETSTWHWRSGRNRIWADAEGLWGVGASGGAILGLYAGEDNNPSATKSWGGLSLSEGDLLLGRHGVAGGGWMLFDQDLVGGEPGWSFGYGETEVIRLDSGGASLYGVLDIDASGGIYQGSGTFASPNTGLKIWNQTTVGLIGGFNAGALQWYSNSDGKMYAGGGNVKLDQNGIQITTSTTLADDITGYATGNMLSFIEGTAANIGGLGASYASGSLTNQLVLGVSDAGFATSAQLLMIAGGLGGGAHVLLEDDGSMELFAPAGISLVSSLIGLPSVAITSDITLTGALTTSGTIYANQASTTGAIDCMLLYQADVSESYIGFAGVTGATNALSNAALGAYYRKIRVNINGTEGWIAIYS